MARALALLLALALAGSSLSQRYAAGFGINEWRNRYTRDVREVLPGRHGVSCLLGQNGLRFVSSSGEYRSSRDVDWVAYRVLGEGTRVLFLTRDGQLQEFSTKEDRFLRSYFVEAGAKVLDMDVQGDTVTLLREDSIEEYDYGQKELPSRTTKLPEKIVDGALQGRTLGVHVLAVGNRVCVGGSKKAANCVEFKKRWGVVQKNSRFLLLEVDSEFVLATNSKLVRLGDSLVGKQVAFSSTTAAVFDSSSSSLALFDERLSKKTTSAADHRNCSLLELSGEERPTVALACHRFSSAWSPKIEGNLEVTVLTASYKRPSLEVGTIWKLQALSTFRLLTKAFLEPTTQRLDLLAARFDDLSTRIFNSKLKETLRLENGLASIAQIKTASFAQQNEAESSLEEYFGFSSVAGSLLWRYSEDVKLLKSLVAKAASFFSTLNVTALVQKAIHKESVKDDKAFMDRHDLRKRLLVLTEGDVIYSMDTFDGSIGWRHYAPLGSKVTRLELGADGRSLSYEYEQVTQAGETATFVQWVSQEDGEAQGRAEPTQRPRLSKRFVVPNEDEGGLSNKVTVDLEARKLSKSEDRDSFVAFSVDSRGVRGFWVGDSGEYAESWNLDFSENETLVAHSYHLKGQETYFEQVKRGFYVPVPEASTLLYKVIDSHNIAVVTRERGRKRELLNLYVLNAKSGAVLAHYKNPDVDFGKPVNLVYESNSIFVSYFNRALYTSELWSIEIMASTIENKFTEMLNKFVFGAGDAPRGATAHYGAIEKDYVMLERKYGLPFGIRTMKTTASRFGLAKANIIAITDDTKVYSLDRLLVSARRLDFVDEKAATKRFGLEAFMSPKLPKYEYEVPASPRFELNAHLDLHGLSAVEVMESQFESTSLVLAHGEDMFFARVAPDGEFDILSSDFNEFLLFAAAGLIVVVIYVISSIVKTRVARNRFLESM